MFTNSHRKLRFDQLHMDCQVRVKGDEACKQLTAKLARNGIEAIEREVAPQGQPYYDYHIVVSTRTQYARMMNLIHSTEGAEMLS